jgi:competence protein ComEC
LPRSGVASRVGLRVTCSCDVDGWIRDVIASAGPLHPRPRWWLLVAAGFLCVAACVPAAEQQRSPAIEYGAEQPSAFDLPTKSIDAVEVGLRSEAGVSSALLLTFLDVGQGDAVLIQAPNGQSVLYDGGGAGNGLSDRLRSVGLDSLVLVIASHNHADHIGGLPDVIREFRPRFVMENGIPHTTRAYERFLRSIEASGSQLLEPTQRRIGIGEVELLILPPPQRPGWGQNDNSVGVIVSFGAFRVALAGDAERRQWNWWLSTHREFLQPVQVHKASHHGSRNGDTRAAIRTLRPEVVVIGVGSDNRYGHPHPEMLALYEAAGATVFRTDRDGTIRIAANASGAYEVRTAR